MDFYLQKGDHFFAHLLGAINRIALGTAMGFALAYWRKGRIMKTNWEWSVGYAGDQRVCTHISYHYKYSWSRGHGLGQA